MNQQERTNRIIARGEFSDHAHVIIGDATVTRNSKGEILIEIGNEDAILKHLIESKWVDEGVEQWTNEHHDINIAVLDHKVQVGEVLGRHGDVALEKVAERTYKYIQQMVFDPLSKRIEAAKD